EGGTCQVGFVKVAVHDEGRANLQLANLLDRQLATLIVGDAKLHLRSGMTDRAGEFHLILLPKEEVRAARLGQSIHVDYANVRNEHLQAPAQCTAQWFAASQYSKWFDVVDRVCQ